MVPRERIGRLGKEGGSIQGTQDKGYLLTLRVKYFYILRTEHYIMTLPVCDSHISASS